MGFGAFKHLSPLVDYLFFPKTRLLICGQNDILMVTKVVERGRWGGNNAFSMHGLEGDPAWQKKGGLVNVAVGWSL